jgi:peptidoglycan hydrolase-like protein with peptidoglycan-binding domain
MARLTALAAVGVLLLVGSAFGAGDPDVAALQVALQTRGLYGGTIDGVAGEATTNAVIAFQKHKRLVPDGVVGPATRKALGKRWSPDLGSRRLGLGAVGWDVAELQFALALHGFPSGQFDGAFGWHVQHAVERFQRYAGLTVVGLAGPQTVAALQAPAPRCPIRLAWPLRAPVGGAFGPRGSRFHPGIDLEASTGTPVGAAAWGRVTWAGSADGYGKLVVVAHGSGVRTFYAHLSRIDVRLGQRVARGSRVGLVGATGETTGPHLHFEVRVRGAAVDPIPALPA